MSEPAQEQTPTDRPCDGVTHRWPSDYQEGDTCNCGEFYVIQSNSGGLMIEKYDNE